MKKRKTFSKEFKARVALDAIKGRKTTGEPSTEYGGIPIRSANGKKIDERST